MSLRSGQFPAPNDCRTTPLTGACLPQTAVTLAAAICISVPMKSTGLHTVCTRKHACNAMLCCVGVCYMQRVAINAAHCMQLHAHLAHSAISETHCIQYHRYTRPSTIPCTQPGSSPPGCPGTAAAQPRWGPFAPGCKIWPLCLAKRRCPNPRQCECRFASWARRWAS